MTICIQCGKPGKRICDECFVRLNPVVQSFSEIKIKLCTCKKQLIKNRWLSFKSLERAVERAVKDSLRPNPLYTIKKIDVNPILPPFHEKMGVQAEGEAEVIIQVSEKEHPLMQDRYLMPVSIQFIPCNVCSKKGTQAFAAILQLRNANDTVLDYVEEKIRKDGTVVITKTQKAKDGIDLYLSSAKFAYKLGKELQDRFGGEVKASKRIHTKDKLSSKDVYRSTMLVRLPPVTRGDIVLYKDNVFMISSLGKDIMGKNILTGKKTKINLKEAQELTVHKTSISKVQPELEALHPETFQSTKILNPKPLEPGQKVKVVEYKKGLVLAE